MRLRQRQTGEIYKWALIEIKDSKKRIKLSYHKDEDWRFRHDSEPNFCYYEDLEGLLSEFEIYEPVEPLIKDREARELVRKFADRCGIKIFVYSEKGATLRGSNSGCVISFGAYIGDALEDGVGYDIVELCGEEEE